MGLRFVSISRSFSSWKLSSSSFSISCRCLRDQLLVALLQKRQPGGPRSPIQRLSLRDHACAFSSIGPWGLSRPGCNRRHQRRELSVGNRLVNRNSTEFGEYNAGRPFGLALGESLSPKWKGRPRRRRLLRFSRRAMIGLDRYRQRSRDETDRAEVSRMVGGRSSGRAKRSSSAWPVCRWPGRATSPSRSARTSRRRPPAGDRGDRPGARRRNGRGADRRREPVLRLRDAACPGGEGAAPAPGHIHHSAVIRRGMRLGKDVGLGAHAVLGDGCVLGDRTVISPNAAWARIVPSVRIR